MNERKVEKDAEPRLAPRLRVDLWAALPRWASWSVALAVAVSIVNFAWLVGRDDPVPTWISEVLVPALGWIYLALLVVAGVHVLRRSRALSEDKED